MTAKVLPTADAIRDRKAEESEMRQTAIVILIQNII